HFTPPFTLAGDDRDLIRVYYYNASRDQRSDPQAYREQQQFFDAVKRMEKVRLVLGRLEARGNVWVEKGVDAQIVVHMLQHAYATTTTWRYSCPEMAISPVPSRPLATWARQWRPRTSVRAVPITFRTAQTHSMS
ncbi:MAG TPA: hypothetical protein DGT21_10185, partial [Armatimonadetes bacterium]|nr:hypothetical protein [Armatimonadota bacterium]